MKKLKMNSSVTFSGILKLHIKANLHFTYKKICHFLVAKYNFFYDKNHRENVGKKNTVKIDTLLSVLTIYYHFYLE